MFADTLVEPLRAVSVLDEALDRHAMGRELNEYAESRDPALVRELPGQHAYWCVLRPLSVSDFATVDSLPSGPAKLLMAFRFACSAIENAYGPGLALRPTKRQRLPDGSERDLWSDDEIALIVRNCGWAWLYELGNVAYERAVQGNGWSGSVSFTLPPSSVLGLERIARRLAEQARRTEETPSKGAPAKPSATTSAPSSGVATDAPAAATTASPGA